MENIGTVRVEGKVWNIQLAGEGDELPKGYKHIDIERKIMNKIFYEYNDIEILWTNIDKRPAKEQIPYRLEVRYKEGLILGLELALEYIKEVSNGN